MDTLGRRSDVVSSYHIISEERKERGRMLRERERERERVGERANQITPFETKLGLWIHFILYSASDIII